MAPCGTPVLLDICFRENPRPDNRTIFSIITDRILAGMITIWFEMGICIQQLLTAECTPLPWGNRGNQHSRERRLNGVARDLFEYCQGLYIDINKDFYQLGGKTVTMVGWFNSIGGQCIEKALLTYLEAASTRLRFWNYYEIRQMARSYPVIQHHWYIVASRFLTGLS